MADSLVLEVVAPQAAQLGDNRRKSFSTTGGTVGRVAECDWVLAGSGVSRVHAVIRHLNGLYFIEDRSTNGITHNGARLVKGEPAALTNGDRLLLDTFEVSVRVVAEGEAMPPPDREDALLGGPADPLPPLDDLLDLPPPDSRAGDAVPDTDDLLGGPRAGQSGPSADPLALLGGPGYDSDPERGQPPRDAPPLHLAPEASSHFRPPPVSGQAGHQAIPDDWDIMADDEPGAPAAAEPPAAQREPPESPLAPPGPPVEQAPQQRVGPPPEPVSPLSHSPRPAAGAPLPPDVDAIMRIVIDGVMEALRARAEIKNSFRLPVTIIQRSENNPLKFAPTPEEALEKIFAPRGAAFLSGADAFEDAFDDIRHHQMAMLAGVRAGFRAMLGHFDPQRFERETDRGGAKRGGLLGRSAKGGDYWTHYRDAYARMADNPDDTFRRLFGDEFASAYEEQMEQLRSSRQSRPQGGHGDPVR